MNEWVGAGCRKRSWGRWQSRLLPTWSAVVLGGLIVSSVAAPVALAQDDPLALSNGDEVEYAPVEYLGNAELPPAIGQPDFAVYIPETGHSLTGVFLDYWRATGGGGPVCPPPPLALFPPGGFFPPALPTAGLGKPPPFSLA